MTARELDAAGITEPALRDAYTRCRRLNARHGRTYFLATRLLPVERRPAVHALYGFARWADDIVDRPAAGVPQHRRAADLALLHERLERGLRDGDSAEPVVLALADTARRYAIDHRHFSDFMASMRSDLDVTDYPTYDALRTYMHGSAAVIGLQMLPILGTVVPREEAAPHAAALGLAFQLTNFLRDVGEDLDRGRVYLPADLLGAHGVDRELLSWSRRTGHSDRRITQALRAFEDLTRGVYREAAPGLAMLDPVARPCIRTAFVLYGGILDAVADDGYVVLHRRAVVPRRRRAAVAVDGLVRLTTARAGVRAGVRRTAPPTARAALPAAGHPPAGVAVSPDPLHEEVV
ncbi:phytoene/squalene synthase family protein [Streptomyces europaeiscabiei]|uniref:Phytoene/squalene synthase family protein n=1 Tax=Streptomyces europaeiscabiei TaxID=146819 RepID=A0ABU4NJN4_9ACTN|nr:phytoene/squalene synthase family protein [Streptomyces europaeiscabiei]MDX2766033.1 phytoene/squalene synthase family protein [Streptomyces europaeiscabiei]MDX2767673.1 phytoene/squalene synthase family protein [Streptomyces europaeiscabiei]MDX3545700.1 phytoene/squalene synthase family protein [Streptomyces europaeiscabiei]MDX3554902.1 phytoene/squalene synthase family protein [Streptomyces europaeiscabiei]MDX3670902.1 phytoene/squalene synthase family protein [Streptomyces europaeiscabie